MDDRKKILVTEDDPDISRLLCDLLEQNGYATTAAFSGTEALMLFGGDSFDLILLDLMIPGRKGTDVLEEIRKTSIIPVIALTAVSDRETVISLLKSGANDYITKPFDNGVLLARIEVQLRSAVKEKSVSFRDISLDCDLFDAYIGDNPLQLSKREFEILSLLVKNPKKVFTKNNLYESVWRDEFMGDDNTVNVHISKIRSKIAKYKPNTEYIQTVWGIGFKMREE